MNNYFESTAKFIRMDENGNEKKVTETYLLDAMSFTEAEARTYKELQEMVSGEFITWSIKRTNISEIIPCAVGDRWYKAKVNFIAIDEETGKEKRTSQYVLVFSDNVKNAYDQIIEAMKELMADFEITAISESKILDVFPFDGAEKVIKWTLEDQDKPTEAVGECFIGESIIATIIETNEPVIVYEEKEGIFFCPEHACSYDYDDLEFEPEIKKDF